MEGCGHEDHVRRANERLEAQEPDPAQRREQQQEIRHGVRDEQHQAGRADGDRARVEQDASERDQQQRTQEDDSALLVPRG